mmetsp:Transcript_15334/g.39028  ORF Transcript_15334/g.39028 Transcript_15334/m.39028 type:complete len:232 (+) Transcript_15334:294-989(+)
MDADLCRSRSGLAAEVHKSFEDLFRKHVDPHSSDLGSRSASQQQQKQRQHAGPAVKFYSALKRNCEHKTGYEEKEGDFDKVKKKKRQDDGKTEIARTEREESQPQVCLICFDPLESYPSVKVSPCRHSFHGKCIETWIEKQNTCPLCRTRIRVFCGRKIDDRNLNCQEGIDEEVLGYYDTLMCGVCGQGDAEDQMILCDGCERGFHTYCLEPQMKQIPLGEWFCEECRSGR